MSILEDIYYGNNIPCEKANVYKELLNSICKEQNKLIETLNEEQKKKFENYMDLQNRLSSKYIKDSFKDGFKLGAELILETIKK